MSAEAGTIKSKNTSAYALERVARRLPRESRAEGRQRSSLWGLGVSDAGDRHPPNRAAGKTPLQSRQAV